MRGDEKQGGFGQYLRSSSTLLSYSKTPEAKVSDPLGERGQGAGNQGRNWLTRAQVEKLLTLPDVETLKGKRDRALLALFVSAGLRREELATLLKDKMQQREGRWCLVDLVGKGGRVRTVAIPDWTQQAVALWLEAMAIKAGPVSGKVNKGGRFVGADMSAPSIYSAVVEYAELLGVDFRPHDLRRRYGKLAHQGGAKIEQIQLSYGHASLATTERYFGNRAGFGRRAL
jgi:site-specific recombinase XerD